MSSVTSVQAHAQAQAQVTVGTASRQHVKGEALMCSHGERQAGQGGGGQRDVSVVMGMV